MRIIIVDDNPKKKRGVLMVEGEIQLDDFRETLYLPVGWWDVSDYCTQWEEGIRRLANHDKSCLVTSIYNPQVKWYIVWWLLYKVGDKIYVQNQLIVGDIYEEQIGDRPFTVDTCYDFIPEKSWPYDEDANEISEWVVEWNG